MTNEEALEILDHNWTRLVNSDYTDIELGQAQDTAIKSLEVVEKIKQAYSNCYKSYLNNLENDFSEETASFAFFQDVAFNINNILCEAYGSDTDCESWVKEIEYGG